MNAKRRLAILRELCNDYGVSASPQHLLDNIRSVCQTEEEVDTWLLRELVMKRTVEVVGALHTMDKAMADATLFPN